MADTGSEIADGATRNATAIIGRYLERELMLRLASWNEGATHTATDASEAPSHIEIGVRCPEGELDARTEEIIEALERGHVRATYEMDDARSTVVLAVNPSQGDATLRALERLSASRRSGFAIDDVIGIESLEAVAGRRALGRTAEARAKVADSRGDAEPVESVALTFARHPEDPDLDARQARAYARRMSELGFDASHRAVDRVGRDHDGSLTRTPAQVVGVSYLTSERDAFVTASGVTLHELGAAGRDDPYAGDRDALAAAREELAASADARREAFAHNRDLLTDGGKPEIEQKSLATDGRRPDERKGTSHATSRGAQAGAGHGLTIGEYEAMAPREQAKVDPDRIPDEAFGNYRAADVAREQSAVAEAMLGRATPDRAHPSIGGR